MTANHIQGKAVRKPLRLWPGVVLAILVAGRADTALELTLGLAAVVLATVNLVGGFVVTDRMLQMFRNRSPGAPDNPGREP